MEFLKEILAGTKKYFLLDEVEVPNELLTEASLGADHNLNNLVEVIGLDVDDCQHPREPCGTKPDLALLGVMDRRCRPSDMPGTTARDR